MEVDTAMELLLTAWSAQRVAEQQQLERLVMQGDAHGKGLADQDEFAALVKQVSSQLFPWLTRGSTQILMCSALTPYCASSVAK